MKANFSKGTKICAKCRIEQPITNFTKCVGRSDGLELYCKLCKSLYATTHQADIKKYKDQYYRSNLDKISIYQKQYYRENREEAKARVQQWRENNPEQFLLLNKLSRDRCRIARSNKDRERKATDPVYKLAHSLRNRVRMALKQKVFPKISTLSQYLGCTLNELKVHKVHLEKQFEPWMTWENHGKFSNQKKTWQIDHIVPLASAKTVEKMYRLCHYTNLQPLSAQNNLSKGDGL